MLRIQFTRTGIKLVSQKTSPPPHIIKLLKEFLKPDESFEKAALRLASEGVERVLDAAELTIVADYHPEWKEISKKLRRSLSG
jgi:hypothetical protein